jgi:hypothetical protein
MGVEGANNVVIGQQNPKNTTFLNIYEIKA